jgi:hypothetical protein
MVASKRVRLSTCSAVVSSVPLMLAIVSEAFLVSFFETKSARKIFLWENPTIPQTM